MECITAQEERFYAAVDSRGYFSLTGLQKRKKDVFVSRSEIEYGDVKVRAIVMREAGPEAPEGDSAGALWTEERIAWVWKNFDGSFWIDTLSLTKLEARDWSSNPERTEAIGGRLVAVRFEVGT